MYMIFSDDYLNDNADQIEQLQKAKDSIYTNDLIFNTMLSIMGIKAKSIYEANNDITSTSYDDDLKRFKTLYGQKNISEEWDHFSLCPFHQDSKERYLSKRGVKRLEE